jgi:hypothetical protein
MFLKRYLSPLFVCALLAGCTDSSGITAPERRSSVATSYDVAMTGPTYAYEESYTVTAEGTPTGSYHYTWTYSDCYVSEPGCNTGFVEIQSGWDVTSTSNYMPAWGVNQKYRVDLRASQSGPILASGWVIVQGAAEANPNPTCTGIVC